MRKLEIVQIGKKMASQFIVLIILVILPLPLSFILNIISTLKFFPDFSITKFYEEYYKLMGLLGVVIIGYWYADKLIEKRISDQRYTDLHMFRGLIEELIKSITKLSEANDSNNISNMKINIDIAKYLFNNFYGIYLKSDNVKNDISGFGMKLINELEILKNELFSTTMVISIDKEKISKIISKLKQLDKEVKLR